MIWGKKSLVLLLFSAPAPLLFTACGSHWDDLNVVRAESGPVHIHRMGGDIEVKDAPHGADLETMGGNIRLDHVESFAKLHSMGGNITVEQADGSVVAETMGGEIRIASAYGPIKASTMGGNITARLAGASNNQRDIKLSSKGGTIRLTVPKDFPMDVRITLAYTRNSSQDFRIEENLGLKQRISSDWESNFGSPRKFIRAEGRVGNGQNLVTIDTINGDVIVRAE